MFHIGFPKLHSEQDVEETDIAGTCRTHYDSVLEGSVMTVKKEKDLSSCTERPDIDSYIPSTGYMTDSPVQSLPIFTSKNMCHQKIEGGVLTMAECEETHKFRPFSSNEGGAVTSAKTTMVLVSHDAATSPLPGKINSPFSIWKLD